MLIALNAQTEDGLQALFELQDRSGPMLIELNMDVTAPTDQKRQTLAQVERMIDDVGHPANSNCADCDWFQVMSIIKHCRDEAVRMSPYVSTTIRIFGARNSLAAARERELEAATVT
jgi:hypothetical protein